MAQWSEHDDHDAWTAATPAQTLVLLAALLLGLAAWAGLALALAVLLEGVIR